MLDTILTWIKDNQILSGTGTLLITGGGALGFNKVRKIFSWKDETNAKPSVEERKKTCRILFIDDNQFKVPEILKKSGWLNAKRVKDVSSLDDQEVTATDIFFVDIQGVGRALKFNDEGLGLALALKTKYPSKAVIIYSAENQGDRFHKALKSADATLSKNADPYEFQQLVEQFCFGVSK